MPVRAVLMRRRTRWLPPMRSPQTQLVKASQREGCVNLGRMRHERSHPLGTATGKHDARLASKLGKDPVEQAVHAGYLAKDHARLHGLAGGTANGRLWRMQLDDGQTCCRARERLRPKRESRRDDAAEKDPLTVEHLDVHGGSKVDYHDRRPIGRARRHHVGNAVGTNLGRIAVAHAQPRLEAGPHHNGTRVARRCQSHRPRLGERWHHA